MEFWKILEGACSSRLMECGILEGEEIKNCSQNGEEDGKRAHQKMK